VSVENPSWKMRLVVAFSDRPSCYVALHTADVGSLFRSLGATRHFCRVLRLERPQRSDSAAHASLEAEAMRSTVFVGWVGDQALVQGRIEIARPFAECFGLTEGEHVMASAVSDAPVATSIMVQPHSVDDWEVVELRASFIEEHLLSQIAVLTPGMVFVVWIHGQMPIKLRVDPKDSNRTPCFLLDRDSELAIESKRRAAVDKKVSLFATTHTDEDSNGLRLRVLATTHAQEVGSCHFDAHGGQVHPEDLELLAGCAAPGPCLVWVTRRAGGQQPQVSRGTEGGDAAGTGPEVQHLQQYQPRALLIRLEAKTNVPRKHLVMGRCLAEHAQVPGFSLVHVRRCRQVPVYVPHIQLMPLCTWPESNSKGEVHEADACWVKQLFAELVGQSDEIYLMDGAIVQLRCKSTQKAAEAPAATSLPAAESQGFGVDQASTATRDATRRSHVLSICSEETDLYEGMSDIDDVYQRVACDVSCSAPGIYEVDLGLDNKAASPGDWLAGAAFAESTDISSAESRPDSVPVRIQFVLGGARRELRHAPTPPFVRLSAKTLMHDLRLTVLPRHGNVAHQERHVEPQQALALLWAATPGLSEPFEAWAAEILRLADSAQIETILGHLPLFRVPAIELRRHLMAQLGCCEGTNLLEPRVPANAVTGGVAVTGSSGTGKTMLCRSVLAGLGCEGALPLEVSCTKLGQPGRKFKSVQDSLHAILRFACWHSPSVIFLDDLDALCPAVEQGAMNLSVTEERSVFLSEMLLDALAGLRACGSRIALMATLPDQSAVHQVLCCHPALEHQVCLRPPQMKERPEMLQRLSKTKEHLGFDVEDSLLSDGALDDWSGQVDGYSVSDLARLVDHACVEATVEASAKLMGSKGDRTWSDPRPLSLHHLERACLSFVPGMMADQSFFTSSVELSDVGGLDVPKQALLDMLTMPTKYAVLFDRAPVRGRRGLMLVGPPGCGKTMLVHAAANATKGLLRFLQVKGPELLSKYIGASEAGVRQVFERAAAAAPSVIFFDEIEALAPRRGGDSTGVTDRVVNQMLCYLDGVEDRGRVYVVAATGRPDLVDAALMRPGRFDKICYCGLPSDAEKLRICEILAGRHSLMLASASDLHVLVSRIPRLFTCADLNALFSSAKIEAVNEALKARPEGASSAAGPGTMPRLTLAHLYAALAVAKPSVSDLDERRYAQIFAAYRPHNAARGTASSSAIAELPHQRRQQAGHKVALA